MTYITLTILGVPFAVPLAVLMAFLDLIPLVGATIGGVVIGHRHRVQRLPDGDDRLGRSCCIVYQQVENNLLQPIDLQAHGRRARRCS